MTQNCKKTHFTMPIYLGHGREGQITMPMDASAKDHDRLCQWADFYKYIFTETAPTKRPLEFPLHIEVCNTPHIPAFGAYGHGSYQDGKCLILLNAGAIAESCREEGLRFKHVLLSVLTHEICHAIQEAIGLDMNEAEVESIVNKFDERYQTDAFVPPNDGNDYSLPCEGGKNHDAI